VKRDWRFAKLWLLRDLAGGGTSVMNGADHQHGPACRIEPPVKTLMVLFDKSDMWHGTPLADAIVRKLDEQGIAGATVVSGVMGYGVHRRIHRKGCSASPTTSRPSSSSSKTSGSFAP